MRMQTNWVSQLPKVRRGRGSELFYILATYRWLSTRIYFARYILVVVFIFVFFNLYINVISHVLRYPPLHWASENEISYIYILLFIFHSLTFQRWLTGFPFHNVSDAGCFSFFLVHAVAFNQTDFLFFPLSFFSFFFAADNFTIASILFHIITIQHDLCVYDTQETQTRDTFKHLSGDILIIAWK